jgi:Sap-like sulfolipid-1-addressing protein
VGTLLAVVAGFGLAAAFTSPGSVVTVIVLLSMSSGVRRGIAFVPGWLLAIGLLALLMIFVLHGHDFSSKHTTSSRVASVIEVALGVVLLAGGAVLYRRPRSTRGPTSTPTWLDRLERAHWSLCLVAGVVMLSYALTLAAGAEILKANVGRPKAIAAAIVFAVTSIVTIAAPVAVVVAAPARSNRVLASWRTWLLANSRSIALVALMVIGAFLIARGAHDLLA